MEMAVMAGAQEMQIVELTATTVAQASHPLAICGLVGTDMRMEIIDATPRLQMKVEANVTVSKIHVLIPIIGQIVVVM